MATDKRQWSNLITMHIEPMAVFTTIAGNLNQLFSLSHTPLIAKLDPLPTAPHVLLLAKETKME